MSRQRSAVIYARVSSRRQAEDGLPVESQISRCQSKADVLGAVVERVYTDAGISGTVSARPQFQAAIEYCERNMVDYFITWSTSRFARDKHDATLFKRRLDAAGTRIIYVSMDIDRATDAGYLTESFMEVMDEYYSRQISNDTKRSMARNAASGYWNGGVPPFGYKPEPDPQHPKRKKLAPVESEATIVREIFQLRLEGLGARAIALDLNSRNITNRGKRWNKATISGLLRNDAVRGCMVYGRRDRATKRTKPREEWQIIDSHQPIIPVDQFFAVQKLMDDATNPGTRGHPLSRHVFTGMLQCGECGASMQVETATGGRGKLYSYYNCRNAQKHGTCEHRRIPCGKLDSFLIDAICRRVFTRHNLERILQDLNTACGAWSTDQRTRVAALESESQLLQRKNTRMLEVLEDIEQADPGLVVKRINDNQGKIDALQVQISAIENEEPPRLDITDQDFGELSAFLGAILKSSENPKKSRHFFASIIDRVIIESEQARICYRPDLLVSKKLANPFAAEVVWLPEPALLRTREVVISLPADLRKKAA